MRTLLKLIFTCCLLIGCQQPSSRENTLVIGTIAGPETELVKTAATVAKTQFGLDTKIIEFSDYNLPNEALNEGSLDANIYQHLPYLAMAKKMRNYAIIPIGKTFLYPMGVYSKKYSSIDDLPEGANIAIPNDPSNEARALILLQHAKLIKLKKTGTPNTHDIMSNPHHYNFKPLEAAQLPRTLMDVDAAIINTTFALPAGLSPSNDAILVENTESPYVNLMVIKKGSPKKIQLKQFLEAFHSDAVKNEAKKLFKDAAIPAW